MAKSATFEKSAKKKRKLKISKSMGKKKDVEESESEDDAFIIGDDEADEEDETVESVESVEDDEGEDEKPKKGKKKAQEAADDEDDNEAASFDRKDTLSDTRKQIEKKYGKGTIVLASQCKSLDIARWPTGLLTLDHVLGGGVREDGRLVYGFPRGFFVSFFGAESCLAGDTFVNYEARHRDGSRANSKGGTIERLYQRFHGVAVGGKGRYQRPATVDCDYFAPSVSSTGRVFQNRVLDVVKTGEKECFRLETVGGFSIEATADHKFFDGRRYRQLRELAVGDTVMVHNNTPYTTEDDDAPQLRRNYWYVKHHPVAGTKRVGRYTYKRLAVARAVIEARMNLLTLDDYRQRLNEGKIDGLRFLRRDQHVHHKNEDFTDDRAENLELLDDEEHGRQHALERQDDLRFVAVEDMISSIEPVGLRQTYDLKMCGPHHNYVANNMVVHNCGKTTTSLLVAAAVQRCCRVCSTRITKKHGCLCGKNIPCTVAWWDAEGVWDNGWAQALGVDLAALHLIRAKSAEDGVDITRILLDSNDIDLLVVDSIACLTPQKELEESMEKSMVGESARLVNRAIRIWTRLISSPDRQPGQQPSILLINQLRMKVGVMFGNPETRPGGRGQFFAEGIALRFGSGQYHYLNPDGSELPPTKADDETAPAWRDVKFTSTKNKTFAPHIGGLYQLWLSKSHYMGVDVPSGSITEYDPLWGYGLKHGLIEKKGGLWRCDRLTSKSKDDLRKKLIMSPKVQGRLKENLLAKLLE